MTTPMRSVLLSITVLGCCPAEAPSAPATVALAAEPQVTGTSALPSARARKEQLSVEYPGARYIRAWNDGHAHDIELATVDPPEQVRDYYRRLAAQGGFKVTETPERLELDGGSAMGVIWIRAARAEPRDPRLQPGEQTLISSSRP